MILTNSSPRNALGILRPFFPIFVSIGIGYLFELCPSLKKPSIFRPRPPDFYNWFVRTKYCEGYGAAFKFLIYILSASVFKVARVDILELNLKGNIKDVKPEMPVEIRRVVPGDYGMLKNICGPMILQRRLEGNDIGIVALYNGLIVSNCWFAAGNNYILDLEREIKLHDKEVYVLGLYVLPMYRKFKIGSAVANRCFLEAKGMGYEKALVVVNYKNTISQQLFKQAGFRKRQAATYLKILGFRKYWVRESDA